MPTPPNELPISNALVEASPESLSDLFSRDPEGYSNQDLDRIIEALRAQRARWQAAEAAGAKPASRSAKSAAARIITDPKATIEDMGF